MKVESEMSKGERMRTHTEKAEGDVRVVQNFSAKEEMEKGTQCVPNLEETFPIEIYTDERIAEFDQAKAELAVALKREILAIREKGRAE